MFVHECDVVSHPDNWHKDFMCQMSWKFIFAWQLEEDMLSHKRLSLEENF